MRKCVCGTELKRYQTKFCSSTCHYANPSPNSGFQKGHPVYAGSEKNRFTKGSQPWNKDLPKKVVKDSPTYGYLHKWVRRWRGNPTECEHCGRSGKIEWANKSHQYLRQLDDWLALCRRCHIKYDRETGAWGTATSKYPHELIKGFL